MVTTGHDDMHGGEMETSIVLHARPELVRDSYPTGDHDTPNRPHLLVTGVKAYSAGGIIGRPSAATPAKGKARARQPRLDSLAASFAYHVKIIDE
jgi:creatinine amidohydrolase